MTPETQEHLDKAREYRVKARSLLDIMHYNDEAGREIARSYNVSHSTISRLSA